MTLRISWASVTPGSEVLAQVHPRIEGGHLVGVSVEHQGLAPEQLADPPFGGLAPAGMIHRRVHVGVEAVLVGRTELPGVHRLGFPEADLDDRLSALEAVLPGHREPE